MLNYVTLPSLHGITAIIRYYGEKHPKHSVLKESTMRTWKKQYLSELERKRAAGEEMSITTLPEKKRG